MTTAAATLHETGVLPRHRPSLTDWLDQRVFDAIYSRSLVYNTCWEDPAVDRLALDITLADTVLVITSAGCNALDYALTAPTRVHAVDANPRQNALLELKLAGIRRLAFDDFFALFGAGGHGRFPQMYGDVLRQDLTPFAQAYWDRRQHWLSHGSGGSVPSSGGNRRTPSVSGVRSTRSRRGSPGRCSTATVRPAVALTPR